MMWTDLAAAVGLLLVLEGIMPFLSPDKVRKTLLRVAATDSATLRFIGLSSMLLGCTILYFLH